MYIKRHMEDTVKKIEKMFGAVIVTGPRQVGKTTLLKEIKPDIPYLTLDDPIMLRTAVEESGTFFKASPPPVFVDEIQYAPNLFPYIKMALDQSHKKGQFYLSGSQQFKLMKNVSESLAGRIGIMNLLGLSLREISGISFSNPFIPTPEYFAERKQELVDTDYQNIWKTIHRGSMPEMYAGGEAMDWQLFYGAYTKAYIERDVRELTQVGDEVKFINFMTSIASCTGQLLNLASVARDVGISQPTADRWLSVLRASNIVCLLQPYFNNVAKRAIKTPKLYFLDTGLAAYLTRWNTPEVLQNGAMAGAFFETFVISEIIKSYYNAGMLEPPLYYYRDKEQNEIDLMIYQDMTLYPIEIKKHADPKRDDIAAFNMLDKLGNVKRGPGGVVCMYDKLLPFGGDDMVIPLKYL
ncbi:putative GTP-binding protein [Syntrophobotulus glycolicus DSM 8271]|uniref:GTP-binding protein n=1 Tax=Syntrophobotulus glycolicus (strain DSM 8271 / FlGlyR) TaxID=645991 RepID=F0SVJ1_SYNGF|nr:ATP-binding protein [Syntrophobotulus glycolicus]ADY54467.1 putative GTP-binding protein [Syntrophobotulus glycolicus DSM 8271]